jgi:predicted DNA-binding protein (MmcQ/YjbR family)
MTYKWSLDYYSIEARLKISKGSKKPGALQPDFRGNMIAPEALIAYCLKMNQAYEDYPFGPEPVCIKVRGKIFAEIYTRSGNYKITLKCDPLLAQIYRLQFPGVVMRGYHCPLSQQPHRNTVWVEQLEEGLLLTMIDHSYDMVVKSLPKSVREELAHGS